MDKDGNKAKKKDTKIENIGDLIDTTAKVITNVVNGYFSPLTKLIREITGIVKETVSRVISGSSNNTTSKKDGGSSESKEKITKKIDVNAKCPKKESSADKVLDVLQEILDWIGWIPYLGDVCDGINAVISYLRGNVVGALISVACMVFSVAADAVLKPLKKSKSVQKVVQVIKDKFGSGVSKIAEWIGKLSKKIEKIPIIGDLAKKVTPAINKFKNYVKGLFDKTVEKSNKVVEKVKSSVGKKISNTVDGAKINGKRIGDMTKEEIKNNVPSTWKIYENNGFTHIKDEKGVTRIRIDIPDSKTPFDHIHIYDELKNPLDIDGIIIPNKKSPDVHIPLKK